MGPIYIQMSCFRTVRAIPPWCPTVLSTNLRTNTNMSAYKQMYTFTEKNMHTCCAHTQSHQGIMTHTNAHKLGNMALLCIQNQELRWSNEDWTVSWNFYLAPWSGQECVEKFLLQMVEKTSGDITITIKQSNKIKPTLKKYVVTACKSGCSHHMQSYPTVRGKKMFCILIGLVGWELDIFSTHSSLASRVLFGVPCFKEDELVTLQLVSHWLLEMKRKNWRLEGFLVAA